MLPWGPIVQFGILKAGQYVAGPMAMYGHKVAQESGFMLPRRWRPS